MSRARRPYAALIPALDCAATIAPVVEGCLEHLARVLVVDDGYSLVLPICYLKRDSASSD